MKYITLQELIRKILSAPPAETKSAEPPKVTWEFRIASYEEEKQRMRPIDPPRLDSN